MHLIKQSWRNYNLDGNKELRKLSSSNSKNSPDEYFSNKVSFLRLEIKKLFTKSDVLNNFYLANNLIFKPEQKIACVEHSIILKRTLILGPKNSHFFSWDVDLMRPL